jgi:hypothetical protein
MLSGAFIYANITAVQHSLVMARSHLDRKLGQIMLNMDFIWLMEYPIAVLGSSVVKFGSKKHNVLKMTFTCHIPILIPVYFGDLHEKTTFGSHFSSRFKPF